MSSFIPYNHPSLALGSIVDARMLDCFKQIMTCQEEVGITRDKLNSLILMKKSVNLTINELNGLQIDTSRVNEKLKTLDREIEDAASDYLSTQIESQQKLLKQRSELSNMALSDMPDSPIDMSISKLESRPLFFDSLNLDSQFFSFAGNVDEDALGNIEKFVRSSTGNMSGKSNDMTNSVSKQIGNQLKNKNLCGTLIIVANCTHRNINTFDPLVLNPDKAISAWNHIYHNECIIEEDIASGKPQEKSENRLHLITGAVYGSSFVGMVHLLKSDMSTLDGLANHKAQLEEKLRFGGWLENMTGGFGVDAEAIKDVKAFLSTRLITTHVSIVSMGVIPTIKSNKVISSVTALSPIDEKIKDKIVCGENSGMQTTASKAEESNNKARLLNMQNARLNSIMTTISEIDKQDNSVLDLNSLMQALDNYITCIKSGNEIVGVPISFYTRNISKHEIIDLWHKKYMPPNKSTLH